MTLQELAREALDHFAPVIRPVSGEKIHVVSDDAPQWVRDMVKAAHGEVLPDDFIYDEVHQSLWQFHLEGDEAGPSIANPYTSGLTRWLASSLHRIEYLESALECGQPSVFELLTAAQQMEINFIHDEVRGALRDEQQRRKET